MVNKIKENFRNIGRYWQIAPVIVFLFLLTFQFPLLFVAPFPSGIFATLFYCSSIEQLAAFSCFMVLLNHRKVHFLLKSLNNLAKIAIGFFFILVVFQFIYWPNYNIRLFFSGLSWIVIPLTVYVYADEFKKVIVPYFSFLWGFCIFHNIWQLTHHQSSIGISGNRNWQGAFLVSCTPLFIFWLFGILKKRKLGKKVLITFLAIPTLFALYSLYKAESRGANLALIFAGLLFACSQLLFSNKTKYKKYGKVLCYSLAGVFLLGILIGPLLFGDKLAEIISFDVRIPLWRGAYEMFLKHPLLGVGSGSYEGNFAYFIPIAKFLRSQVFAGRSTHPHNQFLFFAGAFGLFGLFSLIYLWLAPIFLSLKNYLKTDILTKLVLFCYIMLVFHSMLDLVAMRWPTMQMLLIFQGLLWSVTFPRKETSEQTENVQPNNLHLLSLRTTWITAALSCLICSFYLLWQNTVMSAASRNSTIAADNESFVPAVYFNQQAIKYGCNPEDLYHAGMESLFWLNDYNLAYFYFSELEKHPAKIVVHSNSRLAECLIRMNRKKEALFYLNQEIKVYPLSSIALYNKILLEKDLGDIKGAEITAEKLIKQMKFKGLKLGDMKRILADPGLDDRFHELK